MYMLMRSAGTCHHRRYMTTLLPPVYTYTSPFEAENMRVIMAQARERGMRFTSRLIHLLCSSPPRRSVAGVVRSCARRVLAFAAFAARHAVPPPPSSSLCTSRAGMPARWQATPCLSATLPRHRSSYICRRHEMFVDS